MISTTKDHYNIIFEISNHADFKYDILVVSLRRVAPNTSEQRSRSGLCEGVIRREATETEGLVTIRTQIILTELIQMKYRSRS